MIRIPTINLTSFIKKSPNIFYLSQKTDRNFKTLNFSFSNTRKQDQNIQNIQSKNKYEGLINTNISNFSTSSGGSGGSGGSSQNNNTFIVGSITVIAIALFAYQTNKNQKEILQKNQNQNQKMTLGQDKIKQIQKKSIQLYDRKLSDLIDSFTQEMPPTLKYSNQKDPGQLQQLIDYTISPDINLYEIPSILMANKQNLIKLKSIKNIEQINNFNLGIQFQPFHLSKIKINSTATLSLQAQRCLQNIYIKVKDVADEIEEKGKYTPPKIFFRFFGYIMFDIRQKPLSLLNYRDTEYISLFDLFFDYYSPIPVKRHQYNEYLVGFNDSDEKMFGQIHLNNRKIDEKFIKKDDKVVVMKQNISQIEPKYVEIWDNFYSKYMEIWKKERMGRINFQHQ